MKELSSHIVILSCLVIGIIFAITLLLYMQRRRALNRMCDPRKDHFRSTAKPNKKA